MARPKIRPKPSAPDSDILPLPSDVSDGSSDPELSRVAAQDVDEGGVPQMLAQNDQGGMMPPSAAAAMQQQPPSMSPASKTVSADDFLNEKVGAQKVSADDFLSGKADAPKMSADDFLDKAEQPSAFQRVVQAALQPIAKTARTLGDFGAEGLTSPNQPIPGLAPIAGAIDQAGGVVADNVAQAMARRGIPGAVPVGAALGGVTDLAGGLIRPPATTGEAGVQAGILGATAALGPLAKAAGGAVTDYAAGQVGAGLDEGLKAVPGGELSGGASSDISGDLASHQLDQSIAQQAPADASRRGANAMSRAAEALKPREVEINQQLNAALDESIKYGDSNTQMAAEAKAHVEATGADPDVLKAIQQQHVAAITELNASQEDLSKHVAGTSADAMKSQDVATERGNLESGVEWAKTKVRALNAYANALTEELVKNPPPSPEVGAAVDQSAVKEGAQQQFKGDLLDELGRIKEQMRQAKQLGEPNPESSLTFQQNRLAEEFKPDLIGPKADLKAAVENSGISEPVAMPSDVSSTPVSKDPAPGAVRIASRAINVNRLDSESARNIIQGLSNQPEFQSAVVAQGRGVVPIAKTQARGAALELGNADFAGLRPGEMPAGPGKLSDKIAAAAGLQDAAGKDLAEVGKLYQQGVPIEKLAERIAMNVRGIIGAQGSIAETGRALGVLSKATSAYGRAEAQVAQRMLRDGLMENPQALEDFIKQISQLPSDAISRRVMLTRDLVSPEVTKLAMFQEARAASLLTNPITFLRNVGGNMMFAMSNLIERPLSSYVDFATSQLTGNTEQRIVGEGAANAYGMWSGIKDSARDAVDILLNERTGSRFATDSLSQGVIPGTTGKVIRLPFRILTAADSFFKNIVGNAELHRLAFRQAATEGLEGVERSSRISELLANPNEDMIDAAVKVSKQYSPQARPLEGALASIQKALNSKDPLGVTAKYVIPFFKTPANIARFIFERTPIISELTDNGAVLTAFMRDGMTKGQFADNVARNFIGAGALTSAAVALHANEGRITGSPPKDKGELDTLYATGWRPYSIKVGNQFFSYRGFEPVATYLAATADWAKMNRDKPDQTTLEKAGHISALAVKNFVNQPFLTNLRDLLDALEDPERRSFGGAVRNQVASVIPQGIAAVQKAQDKTLRDPETIVESMMAKTPWLSERVRPKLTKWGEPIARTTYAMGLVDKPLAPYDPIENELRSLNIPHVVGFPQSTFEGKQLSKDDYNQMLQKMGEQIRPQVEQMMAMPAYKQLAPEQKSVYLRQLVDKNRAQITPIYRAKAEFNGLGFTSEAKNMDDSTLYAFGKGIAETRDYTFLNDQQRKDRIKGWLRQLKEAGGR